jgi:hypothetical protein
LLRLQALLVASSAGNSYACRPGPKRATLHNQKLLALLEKEYRGTGQTILIYFYWR